MVRKTPFSDCKTPFSDWENGVLLPLFNFRKWMLLVVKVARHALNHNLFELTEVE